MLASNSDRENPVDVETPSTSLICCSGHFPYVPCYSLSLSLQFQLTTSWKERRLFGLWGTFGTKNSQVVPVVFHDGSRQAVAVSGYNAKHAVAVYDVGTKGLISRHMEHQVFGGIQGPILKLFGCGVDGLASFPSTPTTNPRIVSCAGFDSRVLLSDAVSGEIVLATTPPQTPELVHVVSGRPNHVYVAADGGTLWSFDVQQDDYQEFSNNDGIGVTSGTNGLSSNTSRSMMFSASSHGVQLAGVLRMWSLDNLTQLDSLAVSDMAMSCLCCRDENGVLVGLANGSVEVWDVRRMRTRVTSFRVARKLVFGLSQIDDDQFAVASNSGLSVFRLDEEDVVARESCPRVQGVCVVEGLSRVASSRFPVESPFELSCPYARECHEFVVSLGLDDSPFFHRFSRCFCEECYENPRAIGECAGRVYSTPHGFVKFALRVSSHSSHVLRVFDQWNVAYHGTRKDSVVDIIRAGEDGLLRPGLVTAEGVSLRTRPGHIDYETIYPKRVADEAKRRGNPELLRKRTALKKFTRSRFVSPSLRYAAECYSQPCLFNGSQFKMVFQVRIRPDAVHDVLPVPPFERGQQHTVNRFQDPLFPRQCLEWFTEREHVIKLIGLLVRKE